MKRSWLLSRCQSLRSTKSAKRHLLNEPDSDGAHHCELRRSKKSQRWERCSGQLRSVGGGGLPEIENPRQRYRHELLLPTVSTQVCYVNERTIENFISNAQGQAEDRSFSIDSSKLHRSFV
ncbi:hypothetical protein KIN20_031276 [Parelaphostrongylus tenuis]|uniref:Uncharacterized protein n=1 Tax=Parelaphostrongylus tenuis TaxID=148309 RepID=A0AAD5R4X3_PARTN|nr:hypothetical protein KIN20_031276 [Parelaphostrongylus tenuis]